MKVLFIVGKERSLARSFAVGLMESQHEVKGFTGWDLPALVDPGTPHVPFGEMFEAIADYQPDVVVNAYEQVNINEAQTTPHKALHVNAVAAGFVALACRLQGVRLLHLSSPQVFPGTRAQPGPYFPWDEPYPINTYGMSKLIGERAVQAYAKPGMSAVVRLGYLFGMDVDSVPHQVVRNYSQVTTYVDNYNLGTPTYLPYAVNRLVRFCEGWGKIDKGGDVPVHIGPRENPITWYEFLARRFPLDEPGVVGILPVSQEKDFQKGWRQTDLPRFGGLEPTLETPGYDRSLEAFRLEWSEWSGRNRKG